jgi:hypothetical protein
MKIVITRDFGNLKKGQTFENMSAVEGARLMTAAAAKEVGTCQLTAAEVKQMSASQLRVLATSRKTTDEKLVATAATDKPAAKAKKAVKKPSVTKKAVKKAVRGNKK